MNIIKKSLARNIISKRAVPATLQSILPTIRNEYNSESARISEARRSIAEFVREDEIVVDFPNQHSRLSIKRLDVPNSVLPTDDVKTSLNIIDNALQSSGFNIKLKVDWLMDEDKLVETAYAYSDNFRNTVDELFKCLSRCYILVGIMALTMLGCIWVDLDKHLVSAFFYLSMFVFQVAVGAGVIIYARKGMKIERDKILPFSKNEELLGALGVSIRDVRHTKDGDYLITWFYEVIRKSPTFMCMSSDLYYNINLNSIVTLCSYAKTCICKNGMNTIWTYIPEEYDEVVVYIKNGDNARNTKLGAYNKDGERHDLPLEILDQAQIRRSNIMYNKIYRRGKIC